MNLISISKRHIYYLFKDLRSFEYYLRFFLRLLGVSFVALLWVYVSQQTQNVSIENILIYFLLVASFHYLFTYSLGGQFTEILDNEGEEARLLPGGIMFFAFKNKLMPMFTSALPIGGIILIMSCFLHVTSFKEVLLIIVFLVWANVYYFFFSISMELVGKFINWSEYMAFTLRYIGLVWNGSYIPFVFFTGVFLSILTWSPFVTTGMFLQFAWEDNFNYMEILLPMVLWLGVWVVLSIVLLKSYLKLSR